MKLNCPYCNAGLSIPEPHGLNIPDDVECVPYTRDIGRFDPPDEEKWFSVEGWSRIGKDYLSHLNWERIGILRITRPKLNVQYRVQVCPECKHLFDVYANYTGEPIHEIWPHLFGKLPDNPNEIETYYGKSWILWIIRKFGHFLKLGSFGAIGLGLLFFALSFAPWLILVMSPLYDQFIAHFSLAILIRGIAMIGIIVSLILMDYYIKFIEKAEGFASLLKVYYRRGLIHWRNYTLCRFVGVQEKQALPRITQIDVVVGSITLFTTIITWNIMKLSWFSLMYEAVGLSVVFGLGFLSYSIVKRYSNKLYLKLLVSLATGLVLLIIIIWAGFELRAFSPSERWDVALAVFDLAFWIVTMFILGNAAWIAMNSTVYILAGLSKMPMNLSPYSRFTTAHPLRVLQNYSNGLNLTQFVTITAVVSVIVVLNSSKTDMITQVSISNPYWISTFMAFAVAMIFITLGFSSGRLAFIYITLFYIALGSVMSGKTLYIGYVGFDGLLLIMALFFTSLMAYQLVSTEVIIKGILNKKKEEATFELNEHIMSTRDELKTINESLSEEGDQEKQTMLLKPTSRYS